MDLGTIAIDPPLETPFVGAAHPLAAGSTPSPLPLKMAFILRVVGGWGDPPLQMVFVGADHHHPLQMDF